MRKLMESSRSGQPLRLLVASAVGALMAPSILVTTRGVTDSVVGAVAGCAVVTGMLVWLMWSWLPTRCEGPRGFLLLAVWVALCGAAAWRLGTVGVFMHDMSRADRAFQAKQRTFKDQRLNGALVPEHNCFTAYVVAAQLAVDGCDNLYSEDYYGSVEDHHKTAVHEQLGEMWIDPYQYPPQFLLLPKILMMLGDDFFACRAIWFGLEVIAIVATVGAFANWIDAERFGASWYALPVLLLAPNMLTTLQIGNVHFFILCLAMGGLLAFEKRRMVIGGLLLGFAIVGKIFPVVILIYLAARRKWRAFLYSIGAVAFYTLLTIAVFGLSPVKAFCNHQLPRLVNGEAFSFFLNLYVVKVINVSIAGIPERLNLLGMLGEADPVAMAALLSKVFSLLMLIVLVWGGHRSFRRQEELYSWRTPAVNAALVAQWLALLILAQLRSPLLPYVYGNLAPLWFVTVLAAVLPGRHLLWLLPLWTVLALPVLLPFGPPEPTTDLYLSTTIQMVVFLLAVWTALDCSVQKAAFKSISAS